MLRVEPYSSFSYASPTIYSSEALTQFRGSSVVQGLQRVQGFQCITNPQRIAYLASRLLFRGPYSLVRMLQRIAQPFVYQPLVPCLPRIYQPFVLASYLLLQLLLSYLQPLTSLYISSYLLSSRVDLHRIQRQFTYCLRFNCSFLAKPFTIALLTTQRIGRLLTYIILISILQLNSTLL